jgi:hypothetical protein
MDAAKHEALLVMRWASSQGQSREAARYPREYSPPAKLVFPAVPAFPSTRAMPRSGLAIQKTFSLGCFVGYRFLAMTDVFLVHRVAMR